MLGYTFVALLLVGAGLYVTGYISLPFGAKENFENDDAEKEGFADEADAEDADAEDGADETEKLFASEDEGFVGGYAGPDSEYASAGEGNGASSVPSSDYANCYTRDGLNPSDLLPKASADAAQFIASNPPTAGSPDARNLLEAGYHLGVETVSQSNKNANLQLRADPPIPRTGPQPVFNASTIPGIPAPRRDLEIGSQINSAGANAIKQAVPML